MRKKSLGFLLGFFFGILGLLGLFACGEQSDKDEFMSGWWKAFIMQEVDALLARGRNFAAFQTVMPLFITGLALANLVCDFRRKATSHSL